MLPRMTWGILPAGDQTMRVIFALMATICVSLFPLRAHAAQQSDCRGSHVEYVVCIDKALSSLERVLGQLSAQSVETLTGKDKSAFLQDQARWRGRLASHCSLPQGGDLFRAVFADTALQARPCLVESYRREILKIGKIGSLPPLTLNVPPSELEKTNTYFAVAASFSSRGEAEFALARFASQFPFQGFALFPPYRKDGAWRIMLASYANENLAKRATLFADAVGISSFAEVWSIPEPWSETAGWVPVAVKQRNISFRVPDSTFASPTAAPEIDRTKAAREVTRCYRENAQGKNKITIDQMHACSGFWVTPRALLRCALGE